MNEVDRALIHTARGMQLDKQKTEPVKLPKREKTQKTAIRRELKSLTKRSF